MLKATERNSRSTFLLFNLELKFLIDVKRLNCIAYVVLRCRKKRLYSKMADKPGM